MITGLCLMSVLAPSQSLASFDQPTHWPAMLPLDPREILKAQLNSQAHLYDWDSPLMAESRILSDYEHRVSKQFRVPAELRTQVSFWLKVYALYSTKQLILFDEKHLDIVYEVLDFRDLAEGSPSRDDYLRSVRDQVGRTLLSYRQAFQSLARNPSPEKPTREERRILRAIRRSKHKHSFAELEQSLKIQQGQRDHVIRGLVAAGPYLSKMEGIFRQFGLPVELTRLSLVESSFDPGAVSKVGAMGVWQFMEASGREFLRIDHSRRIDERLSPLKATVAAAKLLSENHEYLHNWPMAVTAYNHGRGRLPRHFDDRAGFKELAPFFDACVSGKPRLGWASRNYFAEFIAMVHLDAYRELFFHEIPVNAEVSVRFVRGRGDASGLTFAMKNGIGLQQFRTLNPDLTDLNRRIPKGFWIAVPGETDDFAGILPAAERKTPKTAQINRGRSG